MDAVYMVWVRDTRSDWSTIVSVHSTPEGAEEARKEQQFIWSSRYFVVVRERPLIP